MLGNLSCLVTHPLLPLGGGALGWYQSILHLHLNIYVNIHHRLYDNRHLIALISYAYHGVHDGSSRHLDLTSLCLKNGISDEPKTNLDTCATLDALVRICFSKGGSQVVTIALQVGS